MADGAGTGNAADGRRKEGRQQESRRWRWIWWLLTPFAWLGSGVLNLCLILALGWFFAMPRLAEGIIRDELAREGFAIDNVDIVRVSMGGVSLANVQLADGPSIGRLDLDWEDFDDSGTPILDRLVVERVELEMVVDGDGQVAIRGFDLTPESGTAGQDFAMPRLPLSTVLIRDSIVHLVTPMGRFDIPVTARVSQAEDRTLSVSADLDFASALVSVGLAADLLVSPAGHISLDLAIADGGADLGGIAAAGLGGWASLTVSADGVVDTALDIRGDSLSVAGLRLDAPHLIAFGGALPEFVTFSAREASSDAAVVADLLAGLEEDRLSGMILNVAADIPSGRQDVDGRSVAWERVWLEVSAEVSAAMIDHMMAGEGTLTPARVAANLPPVTVTAEMTGVDWPGIGTGITLGGRTVLSIDGSSVAARFAEDLRLSGHLPALGGSVAAVLTSPGNGRPAMLAYDWDSTAWRASATIDGDHAVTGAFGARIDGAGHGPTARLRLDDLALDTLALDIVDLPGGRLTDIAMTSLQLVVAESGHVTVAADDLRAAEVVVENQIIEGLQADDLSVLARPDGSVIDVASDIVAERIVLDLEGTGLTIERPELIAAVSVAGDIVTIGLNDCIAFSALVVDADGVGVTVDGAGPACVALEGQSAVVWPEMPDPLRLDLVADRFALTSDGDVIVSAALAPQTPLVIPSFDPFAISGTLDTVDLTVDVADLRFPGTTATVDASFAEETDVAIDIEWATLVLPGQPPPLRPSGVVGQIAIDDVALNFSGGAYPGSGVLLPVTATHDFDSAVGQANVRIAAMPFQSAGLQPHDVFPAVDLRGLGRFDGSVTGYATIRWSDTVRAAAQLSLSGVNLAGDGYSAAGINGTIAFSSLDPLRTANPQTLTIGNVDVGAILRNGQGQVSFGSGNTVTVTGARFNWSGGVLSAAPFSVPLDNPDTSVTFSASGIDLTSLLTEFPVDGLSATGVLDGTVPVRILGDSVHIDNGQLLSRGPGVIRYASGGVGEGQDEGVQLLLDAIENFHYESLGVSLNGRTGGDLTVGLSIRGANPDVYDGYPIALNVNVSGALDDILSEGIQTLTIGDRAREYFQDETTRGTLENILGR